MTLPMAHQKALEIVARIAPANGPVYLVGGFVRDALLGRESADIDLALPGEPAVALAMSRHLANAARLELPEYRASPFSLDPIFGVARTIFTPTSESNSLKTFYLDITVFEGGTIERDLARRDFTVNALAVPLAKFIAADFQLPPAAILETQGGLADIAARLIRPVAEQNLLDDPLRMLRGIRQQAQLSTKAAPWQLAPGTLALFQKHCQLIRRSAAERVRDELNKTWLAGNLEDSLHQLDQSGLLFQLIPELYQSERGLSAVMLERVNLQEWLVTPPEQYHRSPVVLPHPATSLKYWPEMLARLEPNGRERRALLYWAALLLDCGESAAREVMRRLRFSRFMVDQLTRLFRQLPALAELASTFSPTSLSNRAAFRLLSAAAPVQSELLLLALAQAAPVEGQSWAGLVALADLLSRKLLGDDEERIMGRPRLINGQQLTEALKLKPGPRIGQLLSELEEAQAEGQISTTEEALGLARQLLQAEP